MNEKGHQIQIKYKISIIILYINNRDFKGFSYNTIKNQIHKILTKYMPDPNLKTTIHC